MGVSHSGYVKKDDYKQNEDGTFSCKLNTLVDGNPTSITIPCIGTANSNNLTSPNKPGQMIIMSDDNKYIFLVLINNIVEWPDYIKTYLISSAVVNYGISIPDNLNYVSFTMNISRWPDPNDNTFNSLSGDRKNTYKAYLMGQDPPNSLLTGNSDKKVWSDIGYVFKTIYDLNLPDKSANYVPDTYCSNINSPKIITSVEKLDCRSNPNASPIIKRTQFNASSLFAGNGNLIGIGIGIFICLCFCTSSVVGLLMMSKKSKGTK